MKERPLMMSAPMVQAILQGRKTQTRRLAGVIPESLTAPTSTPYGMPGDRLWVREAWCVARQWDGFKPRTLPEKTMTVFFGAGGSIANQDRPGDWRPSDWPAVGKLPEWAGRLRPSIHMPRWCSRIELEITGARIERLHEISRSDAYAEGVEMETADPPFFYVPGIWPHSITAVGIEEREGRHAERSYLKLWDHLHGPGASGLNPWVWVISFKRVEP